MSRKDYRRAADLIASFASRGADRATLTRVFIEFFSNDNPRFDAERFIAAANATTEER